MPVIVSKKNTSIDAIAIDAAYLRLPEVNCLNASPAERKLLLTGTFSLESKYTSLRPLWSALMGEILPTFPDTSNIKAADRIRRPKIMARLKRILIMIK